MRHIIYFILILALFSCNANDKQSTEQANTGKAYAGYDAIRRTILPPLFVLLTNKE